MNLIEKDSEKDKIELCYIWIDEYKLIKKQGFNFSYKYIFKYDEKLNIITVERNNNYINNFFENNIVNITALVGKNGSGKSLILNYLSNNLFALDEKKVVIYRKNTEIHILYGGIKKPMVDNDEFQTKYYDWNKEYEDSEEELSKNLSILNSVFYSNVFYDSNESANSGLCNASINISTGFLMRTKKSNNYVYRQNNIAQVDKIIAYDKLLMLQFLLDKKDYIDKLILPCIKYVQFEVKNNYLRDKKNEHRFISIKSTMFMGEGYFNKENDKNFEEIKKRNGKFRDDLFEKLVSLDTKLEMEGYKQNEFFKLNTIMNLIYDFYCSVYDSTNLEKDINIKLYELMNCNKNFIEDISIKNIEYSIKEFFKKVKGYYYQIRKVSLVDEAKLIISDYKEKIVRTIKKIKEYKKYDLNDNNSDIEYIEKQVKEFLLLILKDMGENEYRVESEINTAVNKYIQDGLDMGIVSKDIKEISINVLKYDYEEFKKDVIDKAYEKIRILLNKKMQIDKYINFIDALSELDNCWLDLQNNRRLIIELNQKNILMLKKFINIYYNIDVWGYYNFKWVNRADEDRRCLSSGEESMFKMYSRLYSVLKDIDNNENVKINKNCKNILVLMDEPEAYLHPEWQIKLISRLINFFKEIFNGYNIQVVITSNTPFLISDLPNENVILLHKSELGESNEYKIEVLDNSIMKTFGQNVHTLLKQSFFMDTTIGDFSKEKINKIIKLLNNDEYGIYDYKEEVEKIINMIGEPLIQNKLLEMLQLKLNFNSELEKVEKQIEILQKRKKELLKKERGSSD